MLINRVIDYEAKGMAKKPQKLHREDCPHPEDKHAVYRLATAEELRALPECQSCINKEQRNKTRGPKSW